MSVSPFVDLGMDFREDPDKIAFEGPEDDFVDHILSFR
jgi:hypothetical protein